MLCSISLKEGEVNIGNLDWEGQSRGKEAASSPGSYWALPGAAAGLTHGSSKGR